MADTISKERRSSNMSKIRSSNTAPEILVRKNLHRFGLRYRLNVKDLPGKPDLYFPKYKAVIFVHGCYWHSHGCSRSGVPKSNTDYWGPKLARTKARDAAAIEALNKIGIRCLVIWECSLVRRTTEQLSEAIEMAAKWVQDDSGNLVIEPK